MLGRTLPKIQGLQHIFVESLGGQRKGIGMGRISAVLERHKKLLSLLGALIVFVTFVVNDLWKERVQSQSEAITSAEVGYRSAEEFASVRKQVIDLEYQVDDRQAEGSLHSVPTESSVIVNSDARDLTDRLRAALKRLNDQLPNDRKVDENLQERRTRLEQLRGELNALRNVSVSGNVQGIPGATTELRQVKNEIWRQYWMMIPLGTELLADAEKLKVKRDQKLKVVNSISYALYMLGWALGVAGQLVGTK